MRLTHPQRERWDGDGFFVVEGFADAATCSAMLERAVAIARQGESDLLRGPFVMPEARPNPAAVHPEDRVSKIFKLHRRDPVFRDFATRESVLELVSGLLGADLDCFLSQFIFKNPGAMGQPWHQDSFYFPFDRGPQVGIWLAVTDASLENGCLHVLPASHREPVHTHVPDRRPQANYGYMEIVDRDTSAAAPLTMRPGDLLVFHSHLMHCSRDNVSSGIRAAMVYHYAECGTREPRQGQVPINDWMPVLRAGRPVPAAA